MVQASPSLPTTSAEFLKVVGAIKSKKTINSYFQKSHPEMELFTFGIYRSSTDKQIEISKWLIGIENNKYFKSLIQQQKVSFLDEIRKIVVREEAKEKTWADGIANIDDLQCLGIRSDDGMSEEDKRDRWLHYTLGHKKNPVENCKYCTCVHSVTAAVDQIPITDESTSVVDHSTSVIEFSSTGADNESNSSSCSADHINDRNDVAM